MDLNLTGKRALITGATRGIGLAIAQTLAKEGMDLYLAARSQTDLVAVAKDLILTHKIDVDVFPTDLTQSVNIEALAMECGDADVLINNAGDIPIGGLDDLTMEQWRKGWDLKVFGYIQMAKEMYEFMAEETEPDDAEDEDSADIADGESPPDTPSLNVILNIGSATAAVPDERYICGSVGNAAIDMFTRTLGGVSLDNGVRVIGLNPGQIATDRVVKRLKKQAEEQLGDAERWPELAAHLPGGGPGTPEQVADMVAFLISDKASHLSGETITMDGGFTAQGKSF